MATTLDFIITAHDRASKVFKDVGDAGEKAGGKFDKWKAAAAVGAAAAGVALVKFAADSVQAYSEAEEAQKSLQFAFEKFPGLADTNIEALRSLNTELAKKTKYDDDAIASGQASLAQFKLTGSQIEDVTPLLLDYASKTGKDMPAAAQDLGKALLGNAKALKNIGISYKSTGDSTQDFANITQLMRDKVGGFAEKEGATAAGRTAILKNQFGELQETVGSKLLPVLTNLTAAGLAIVNWINENQTAALALGITFGVLATVIAVAANWLTISTTAIRIVTAAQWLWNAAMSANPIGLIILGIAALVAGFLWLWQNVDGFKQFFLDAWSNIQKSVANVVNWVKANWPLLVAILTGGISLAVTFILDHWGQITALFKSIPGAIASALGTVASVITAPFRSAFASIAHLWNSTVGAIGFTVPDWIPGVGGKTFNVPDIPGYASGVNFAPGGWATVGERGPEKMFVPRGSTILPHGQEAVTRLHPDDLGVLVASMLTVADAVQDQRRSARSAASSVGLRSVALT